MDIFNETTDVFLFENGTSFYADDSYVEEQSDDFSDEADLNFQSLLLQSNVSTTSVSDMETSSVTPLDFEMDSFDSLSVSPSSIVNPTGFDFTVTVDNQAGSDGDNVLDDVFAVTNAALSLLSGYISAVAGASLDVAVTIESQGASTIASAGPGNFSFGGIDAQTGFAEFLTVSQIEFTEGFDPNGDEADIFVTVNSDFLLSNDAFLSTDPNRIVPNNTFDYVSVLVHEIVHGLGFLSFRDNTGADDLFDFNQDGILDAIESSFGLNVEFGIENSVLVPRYTGDSVVEIYGEAILLESTFDDPGSDVSHFAEFNPDGSLTDTAFSIESPLVSLGDVLSLDALTLAVLQDIGYDVRFPADLGLVNEQEGIAFTPTVTSTEITTGADGDILGIAVNSDGVFSNAEIPSSVGIEVTAGDGTTTQTARLRFDLNSQEAILTLDDDFLAAHSDSGVEDISVRLFFPAQLELANGTTEEVLTLTLDTAEDQLLPTIGDDVLVGTSEEDFINGRAGADFIDGGAGDDTLIGGPGDDMIVGGDGADEILGASGNDVVSGNDGADIINGGGGDDTLNGGNDDDVLSGSIGEDLITGGAGADFIIGNNQSDMLFGNIGEDQIFGGAGNDMIDGGGDNDMLIGGAGRDEIMGGAGDDTLEGNSGGDNLSGDEGNDVIFGGGGNDTLNGGAGIDTFVFTAAIGTDRIQDFEDGIDVLDLSGFILADDIADVMAAATQVGANIRLDFNANNVVVLEGVNLADLDASDFVF